jgi:hypothetical protein
LGWIAGAQSGRLDMSGGGGGAVGGWVGFPCARRPRRRAAPGGRQRLAVGALEHVADRGRSVEPQTSPSPGGPTTDPIARAASPGDSKFGSSLARTFPGTRSRMSHQHGAAHRTCSVKSRGATWPQASPLRGYDQRASMGPKNSWGPTYCPSGPQRGFSRFGRGEDRAAFDDAGGSAAGAAAEVGPGRVNATGVWSSDQNSMHLSNECSSSYQYQP